jgi:hypothetical protein
MQNSELYPRFIEWVSDYCTENDLPFDSSAVRVFRNNLTAENFEQCFSECCDFIHHP